MWAGRVTIHILPNDVLLLIFLFDGLEDEDVDPRRCLPWHRLVHVCQRWRSLVFSSPKFLDLRLVCGPWAERGTGNELFTSAIWPPLPVLLRRGCYAEEWENTSRYFDAAIVDPTRVREIDLTLTRSPLADLVLAMDKPFPALTCFRLALDRGLKFQERYSAPALTGRFLGGSAPNLQYLELYSIEFRALPELLLSATNLVCLSLSAIPRYGHICPMVMSTGLAALAKLQWLTIDYKSSISCPDPHSPLPTRTILPALTHFVFHGTREYVEDFVSSIDAPLLHDTRINFFQQPISDIPQLTQFMRRTTRFEPFNEVHVDFAFFRVLVGNFLPTRDDDDVDDEIFRFRISAELYTDTNAWHSSLAFLVSIFPFISIAKHIYLEGSKYSTSHWRTNLENTEWLEMFYPFTALENLYIFKAFARRIAPALQKLVEGRVTEVLPTLQNIFLEGVQPSESGPIQEVIEKFVAARQLSGHPITVSLWERCSDSDSDDD